MERPTAVERVIELVETVESQIMPVPVREVWVYGDIALGMDPVDRLDVYLTKDLHLGTGDQSDAPDEGSAPDVKGIGQTVRTEWADRFPEYIRTNDSGYAAPERCLAAHLVDPAEPIHLEVCNTGFENNVMQRLQGALETGRYERILDPRGVCLWIDGQWSQTAVDKLSAGEFVFPTLPAALEMLDVDAETAAEAAEAVTAYRTASDGRSVRGDVL